MNDTILPHALPHALDGRPDIHVLSLDCFDTLLWRDTHAPRDIFSRLPDTTPHQRMWAESGARQAMSLSKRRNEVKIGQIYAELMPNGTQADRQAAIDAEIDAEARHCYAFVPTVELMREAKRLGLQVVIVSDTYLDEGQLLGLIARAAGDEVAGLIDRVFCSSTYGRAKAEGMYEPVLRELKIDPAKILHIGDNKRADVDGVAPFGVQTLHLKQFTATTEQRLRQEAAISAMLNPQTPGAATTYQPHRPALAAIEPQLTDPAQAFGFATLGPVLHGFDQWLDAEADALARRHGGTVHYLFLMRDGHLPKLVHSAAGRKAPAHAVEISRFTATAASFTDDAAIERYVMNEIKSDLATVASQLLLPPAEAGMILKKLSSPIDGPGFLRAIRTPQRLRRIAKSSAEFAERLVNHVRNIVQPAEGDTLMLVDLGYNGSVQNLVEPLLRDALKVQVAGRYVLLREQLRSGFDKRGFLGPDHYDAHMLEAMCTNVAVLEQLCTAAQGSVVDYQNDGTPIRKDNSIKSHQSLIRERIQAGCLRFVRDQAATTLRRANEDVVDQWRQGAASVLGRLMFLPMPGELAVVDAFEHDVNLGCDQTVKLFDPAIAQRGLKQRGLFYMKGAERMYLPAELQGEGLALKLTLLAHKRFGLALKYADFIDQTISLPVIIADGREVSLGHVTATPTHDGYYLAPIPIADSKFAIGLQFGKLYEWLQVDSATFMPVDRFLSEHQRTGLEEIEASPSLEGMQQTAPHLFRCDDEAAFMMVPPPPRQDGRPMMLAVVFRPIVAREVATPQVAPAPVAFGKAPA